MSEFNILTFLFTISYLLISPVFSATFTFTNKCDYTVWPGLLSGAGTAPLSTTGFTLAKSPSKSINVPSSWSGRLWGRTLCSEASTGKFSCVTGDCGSSKLECLGAGAVPPTTLAEFTLNGIGNYTVNYFLGFDNINFSDYLCNSVLTHKYCPTGWGGQDFYDVSLVDGYNLPMLVVPEGGTGPNCTTTGCVVDLNNECPSELKVDTDGGDRVACRSACEAFGEPEYCCSGAYGTPDTCKPSRYSEVFKKACPHAYSYAYDDKTSTFICGSAPDYVITFCPSHTTSKKAATEKGQAQQDSREPAPLVNNTMVYQGIELDVSSAFSRMFVGSRLIIAYGVAILAAIW